MKTLLLILFSAGCYAQSLAFTSADGRCVAGTPIACTFTQMENSPPDFGIKIHAAVSGSWTLQSFAAICGLSTSPAFLVDGTGAGVSTLSSTADYYLTPWDWTGGSPNGQNSQYKCPAGNTTVSMDWKNGGTTVSISIIFAIKLRPAFPIMLNGYHIPDADLSAYGWTVAVNPPQGGFPNYLNAGPCIVPCGAYVDYTPPQNAGDSIGDDLGNSAIAITPKGIYEHQESGKNVFNLDNTLVITINQTGNGRVWVYPPSGNTPREVLNPADYNSNDQYCWSAANKYDLYLVKNTSLGSDTIFKKLTFDPVSGYTPTDIYTMPYATYGTAQGVQFGHQDCTADNWMPFFSWKTFDTVGTVVGTTFTRTLGSSIDALWVGQNIYVSGSDTGKTVVSVNTGAQTAVISGTTVCVGCTFHLDVPFGQGAIHLTDAMITPVFSTLAGNTNYVYNYNNVGNGGGMSLAPFPDPADGKLYGISGSAGSGPSQNWNVAFTPGVDSALTFKTSFSRISNPYTNVCSPVADGSITPGLNVCLVAAHQVPIHLADGTPWYLVNNQLTTNGAGLTAYRFRDAGITPTQLAAGSYSTGNYFVPSGPVNEFGSARGAMTSKAPFWVQSSNNLFGVEYILTNCSAASPTACTTDVPIVGSPLAVLIQNASGCTALNGLHTATIVSGTSITINVNCSGGAQTGTAYFAPSAATDFNITDVDQFLACRMLTIGIVVNCYRFGHTKTLSFTKDQVGYFYSTPRAAMSMDGSKIAFGTSFGTPNNVQLVAFETPFCLGMADNAFDCAGHAVTPTAHGTYVDFAVSSPGTGSTVIEVGKELRLTDGHLTATPSGACGVPLQSMLSLANSTVYTCLSATWAASTPDSTYKVAIDNSVAANKNIRVSDLDASSVYYYRIITNGNQSAAGGTFTTTANNENHSGINTTGAVSFRGAAVAR